MGKARIIHDISELNQDVVELVFDRNNPLYIKQLPSYCGTLPDRADNSAMSSPESSVKRVGIFVDDMPQNVVTRVYNYKLSYIKFCGNETVTYIENIKRTLIPDIASDIKIIKVVQSADAASDYIDCVDVVVC
ncbi:hypothetical protein HPS57_02935 [Prevotella sp. PINT]|jgi:Phosphoribosylanthranilate isomerase|uniref:hypothetical protein n=1 Tax=Palleniella intestinalis TaxID=2736291 RepID=UPI001554E8C3|nr:hypothetical protein [Palleniella intestinalis]NPD80932.1 hypothetical protein [Palleniella intestinalis]